MGRKKGSGPTPGSFKKGNKAGALSGGPRRPDFLSQRLISMLNEVDRNTGQERLHQVCEVLFKCAVGGPIQYKIRDDVEGSPTRGKIVTREIILEPEGWAMKELWDRVQGKAVQTVAVDPENNKFTLVFDEEDADAV